MPRALRAIGGAVLAGASVYGGYVAVTYLRFGRPSGGTPRNALLDRLMPACEVRERHSVHVSAPVENGVWQSQRVNPASRTLAAAAHSESGSGNSTSRPMCVGPVATLDSTLHADLAP